MHFVRWLLPVIVAISFGLAGYWLWSAPKDTKHHHQQALDAGTKQAPFFTQSFAMMGTHISLQTPFSQRVEAYAIVHHVFTQVDLMMSEWKSGSPLAAVNRAAGKVAVQVPQELFALLERCQRIGKLTDGAFDMSWAALWGLWDFKKRPPQVPDARAVAAKRRWVDFRKVQLFPKTRKVYLPYPAMKLGLGGIAKGYALDQAVAELRKAGVRDFLLSAGGHVYVSGHKHGRLWQVGIRDPRGAPDSLLRTLHLTDTSVSTSGDYERFFMHKGKRYHHILDPRTGYPSKAMRSATVISTDATLADALSTALMILPAPKGLAIARQWKNVKVVLVDHQGKITPSLE